MAGPTRHRRADEKNLPVRWSATENVAWKAPLGGVGVSSPIVAGDRVFVTSQIGAGVRRAGNHPRLAQGDAAAAGERALAAGHGGPADDRTFFVVEAFSRADGKRLWQYRFEATGPLPGVHDKHNLASPSPVTDGQMVYAWFGTGQIVALDMNGKLVWQRNLGQEIAPFDINWGHSSSPTLYDDTCSCCAITRRPRTCSPSTRRPARNGGGRIAARDACRIRRRSSSRPPTGPELIVNSSQRVDAYDPRTGTLLWHVGGSNQFPIPSPTFHDGVVYMTRGYRSGPYMAVRPGGRGDVSASHVVWQVTTGAPYISSLVYDGGSSTWPTTSAGSPRSTPPPASGSGRSAWKGSFRRRRSRRDGKIYFVSETGEIIVLKAGRQPEVLARNDVGERLIASPAISNGQIFLRSDGRLFAIGKR